MGAVSTLRAAVNTLLDTVEWRALGVVNAVEAATKALLTAVTSTVVLALTQAVDIVFSLTTITITSAFDVVGSVVDAALGEGSDEEVD